MSTMLKLAEAAGVEHMLCVSIDINQFDAMMAVVEPYPQISVSVGLHPLQTDVNEPDIDTILSLADNPRVVAIGETGLDYFYHQDQPQWQQQRFRTHIQAAKRCHKPVIVHTRDARQDTLAILTEESARDCGGVIHCFTEDWPFAKAALDLGFYISFSGIVTFKNAEQIREVARKVPDDLLLIETDAPYLAPVPKRGKQNYPGYVKYVAECIAEVRGAEVEHIAEISKQNYQRLFGPINS